MKRFLLFLIVITLISNSIYAQNVGVGTLTPNASAALEIKASNRGILIPRTSTVSRTAIISPAKGLMVYDTTISSFWFHNGNVWVQVENSGNGWSLTGNAGTDNSINFLGTTDKRSLQFKVNKVYAGAIDTLDNVFIGPNAGQLNKSFGSVAIGSGAFKTAKGGEMVAIGFNSLSSNVNGIWNTAVGSYSLAAHKTGNLNTAIGYAALDHDTSGISNSAVGAFALSGNKKGINNNAFGSSVLFSNDSGSYNTGAGSGALYSNTGGNQNSAFGRRALYYNILGNYNVAIGNYALHQNTVTSNLVAIGDSALFRNGVGATGTTEGTKNTAIGSKALYANGRGYNNTAVGSASLYNNTDGRSNTAVGALALFKNGTGANVSLDEGTRNTAIGEASMYSNTTGLYNTAIGAASLYANTTGYFNTAVGLDALQSNLNGTNNTAVGLGTMNNNSGGQYNTALGSRALDQNTGGEQNTAIGYNAGHALANNSNCTFLGANANSTGNFFNSMALGCNSFVDGDNQVRIGSIFSASIGGSQPWSNLSDGRYKKNVQEDVKGLAFILKLRPVTYNLDLHSLTTHANMPAAVIKHGDYGNENIRYTGFVAQEVETAAQAVNYDFSGVDKPKNPAGQYALRYSEFVVPLVKAVQEQQAVIEDQNKKLATQQQQIDMLLKEIQLIKAKLK